MRLMVCLFGNIFRMGRIGFLHLSTLRWVVVLVFASGLKHGVGEVILKEAFLALFRIA